MSSQASPAQTPPPTTTVRIKDRKDTWEFERGSGRTTKAAILHLYRCCRCQVGVVSPVALKYDVTMACLYVSTKLHDTLKKPRDILMAAYYIRLPELAAKSKTGTDVDIDQAVRVDNSLCLRFIHLPSSRLSLLFMQALEADRHRLISIERLILETICFNFRVRLPFSYVIKMCREFHGRFIVYHPYAMNDASVASKDLAKLAWRLSIDSNRTLVPLQFPPHTIALGCIYLAALLMSADPNGPATSPTQDSRENSFRGDDPSMIVAKLAHPGEWETKFYSRVEQLEDIAHALLDLLLSNPSSTSLHANTSPTTPSSPSPSQQQSQSTPATSTVPANYSTAQLTRLKIQLREQEQQEQRDRRPVRSRVRSAMDADAVMNALNGVGDSNEGTVRFLFGLPGE
ncbi:hypothetical protein AG1IA_07724 [Rhizoctonia solani AG-1 IA]|uniref:Uncharacterized protein n=1 Tax=Thanatephorus cucumeris (strain AG1-IA) TaxID=983506 RepID=L8WND9_THACA|nr:hypothetical protein AG1IA_07724 [Rhizoctonia solani AG-1 IA]